ncbi:acyl-CoA thioesterase [Kitasatospora cineracea]|uniref:Acyl-CoA thioesterase 2 n=1 Tax=Kitasatospora cineracea TaxID=88074 RepID=A0A8G1UMH4_9ACTN|nr:acyl-CoA thioesterase II [Kitasatospora cineracea]ROR46530.1 acyl-CoA thioesterase-2 [Kitasatospora cineracea]
MAKRPNRSMTAWTGTPPGGLLDFLELERVERDLFRGVCHEAAPLRAFGGQVAAQALTAAGHTVPADRPVHSLHGYFLRPGDTKQPIVYAVERLRDGGSYVSRRVSAVQDGEMIFSLSASFKRPEPGFDRQRRVPPTAGPDELPSAGSPSTDREEDASAWHRVLDIRQAAVPAEQVQGGQTEQRLWIRAARPLSDDPLTHACALAYASDLGLAPTAALEESPSGQRSTLPSLFVTSLDHAIWYHRPFRADEWMLFAQRSPSAGDGRGLAMADVWDQDGLLVASVVQETVLRGRR